MESKVLRVEDIPPVLNAIDNLEPNPDTHLADSAEPRLIYITTEQLDATRK
jgi:hypothetical protein